VGIKKTIPTLRKECGSPCRVGKSGARPKAVEPRYPPIPSSRATRCCRDEVLSGCEQENKEVGIKKTIPTLRKECGSPRRVGKSGARPKAVEPRYPPIPSSRATRCCRDAVLQRCDGAGMRCYRKSSLYPVWREPHGVASCFLADESIPSRTKGERCQVYDACDFMKASCWWSPALLRGPALLQGEDELGVLGFDVGQDAHSKLLR